MGYNTRLYRNESITDSVEIVPCISTTTTLVAYNTRIEVVEGIEFQLETGEWVCWERELTYEESEVRCYG